MTPPAAAPPPAAPPLAPSVPALWELVTDEVRQGHRFAGLMGTSRPEGVLVSAHLAVPGDIAIREALVPAGVMTYPALTPILSAADWYEREISDVFGLRPEGYAAGAGQPGPAPLLRPHLVPAYLHGPGLFTIPHGPVRSGVMESIEYLVQTPGEDIPHLDIRLFYKHRGVEDRFERLGPAQAVLLAERTEGVASVAHALAYCHAIERLGTDEPVPWRAALIRALHAELERISSHLDVTVRLADAAGLAVAAARFGFHKEQAARLVSAMCGSRFGRGVVRPGGVSAMPSVSAADFLAQISKLERAITSDLRLLMGTASFLDRLRATGPLTPGRAKEHGALGPIGKASGRVDDARRDRPYDAYPSLGLRPPREHHAGDALARLAVRVDEIRESFHLLRQAADELDDAGEGPLSLPCDPASGRATGWAEAPQGEVSYDVRIEDGQLTRCHPRSASFHNLMLFGAVFAGDILTDFPFIEASFGLSVAGVAR
jgi:Ni,Fe-hydrogenase III large subunit